MSRLFPAAGCILLVPLLLAGCASPGGGDLAPGERALTLVFLKTGPESGKLPKEENERVFAGHFANMARMAEERQLLVAGPFGPVRHDPALRGLFVLDTGDRGLARDWAATDPPTQAGVFVLEYHDLATAAPLAACLERELAKAAAAKAEGRTPQPGEGGRSYVVLTAEDGARARAALAPLVADGRVLMLARLDGSRAFALLDATDIDAARQKLGPAGEALGEYVLDSWFGGGELARLPAPGPIPGPAGAQAAALPGR